jgi:hypothetical protein
VLPNITTAMNRFIGIHDDIREKALKRLDFENMKNDKRPNDPGDSYY